MHLDVQTLSVVNVFVTTLLGALLVFSGLQNRAAQALLWWGAGFIAIGAGLGLAALGAGLAGAEGASVIADATAGLILFGYAVNWSGVRLFERRALLPFVVLGAPLCWLVFCRLPGIAERPGLPALAFAVALAGFALIAAAEFWRGRAVRLPSRRPLALVLCGQSVLLVALGVLLQPWFTDQAATEQVLFGLLGFGTLPFAVVMAFLELSIAKERLDGRTKAKAATDPLTGVACRRAFLDGLADALARLPIAVEETAVLVFDLDGLRRCNEKFGHAVGDEVLQLFATSAAATLGGEALFGRLGGDEFAACITVGDLDEAFAIADRVRRNFNLVMARRFTNEPKVTEVSIGVALGNDPRAAPAEAVSRAEQALARAKELGGNRVELDAPAPTGLPAHTPSIVPIIGRDRVVAPLGMRRWQAHR